MQNIMFPVFQFHGLKNCGESGFTPSISTVEFGLHVVKVYLCASKPPSLKSLVTPRNKAEVY
jgi:hypothetical protein